MSGREEGRPGGQLGPGGGWDQYKPPHHILSPSQLVSHQAAQTSTSYIYISPYPEEASSPLTWIQHRPCSLRVQVRIGLPIAQRKRPWVNQRFWFFPPTKSVWHFVFLTVHSIRKIHSAPNFICPFCSFVIFAVLFILPYFVSTLVFSGVAELEMKNQSTYVELWGNGP